MANQFLTIVISHPAYLPNEADLIVWLFQNGLDRFHLRKPNSSKNDIEHLLNAIPEKYHDRISVHYYRVKQRVGFHYQKNCIDFANNTITSSYSAHHFDEINNYSKIFDYIFLSPIFNSISKIGYISAFKESELCFFLQQSAERIIALGGINTSNVSMCKTMGFAGIALLGFIWEPFTTGNVAIAKQNWISVYNKLHNDC